MRNLSWLTAVVLLFGGPLGVSAYDSVCYRGAEVCTPGPDAARNRWVGASDEHRQLWELTRLVAGLPPAVSDSVSLAVFTADGLVGLDSPVARLDEGSLSRTGPTLEPVAFSAAARVEERSLTIGEFAQLPDHGYALWDWARGFETCPLDGTLAGPTTTQECHTFSSHMGAVNANHFLPQAQHFYRHYHDLALGRAAACRTMRERIEERGGDPTEHRAVLRACEAQALLLEAVGHHFLQDAWSSGHMWERWGSPDLAEFPSLARALVVAATSGLIHGARALLQPLGEWAGYDVNDALCAPHPEVAWRGPDHTQPQAGRGDLYLPTFAVVSPGGGAPPELPAQFQRLFSCAVAGMLAVYEAAGSQHGPATPQSGFPLAGLALESVDPTSAACFGQRATNLAMKRAAGVDYIKPDGTQDRLELDPGLVTYFLPTVIRTSESVLGAAVDALTLQLVALNFQYSFDLAAVMASLELFAKDFPQDTDSASGQLGPLLDILGNKNYGGPGVLAPYVDPPLPWPGASPTADTTERSQWLARTFHQAHATDWCDRFAPGAAEDLAALRQRAKDLAAGGTTGPVLEAACGACSEFAARAHRRGSDESDFDPNDPPLCYLIAGDPDRVQYAYQDGAGENAALAAWWCGCPASVEIEADFGGSGEPASITASHTSTARGGTVSGRVRVTDAAGRVAYPAGVLVEVSGIGAGGGSGETDDEGGFEIGVDVAGGPREVTFDVVARAESGGRVLAETRIRATIDDEDDDDDDPDDECEDFRPDGVYLEKRSSIAAGNTIASYSPTPATGTFIYQLESADQLRKRTDLPGASIDRYFGSWTGSASRSGSGSRSGITSSGSFSAGHTSEMQGQPVTLQYPGGDPYDGFLFQGFTFQATAATTVNHTNSGTLRAESSSVANGATCVEFSVVGKPASFSIASDLGPGTYVEFDGSPCAEDGESFYRYYINEASGFPPGTVEGDLTRAGLLEPGGYRLCVSLTAQSRIATNAPAGGQPDNPSAKNHSLDLTFSVQ